MCADTPPFAPKIPKVSSSRSEEHTSELQSLTNLVCRLLLEKKIRDRQAAAARGTEEGRVGDQRGEEAHGSLGRIVFHNLALHDVAAVPDDEVDIDAHRLHRH